MKLKQKGQSLIEILVAIALAMVILPALLTGFVASREGKATEGQRLQAITYLKEAEEAVRSVREKGWTAFAVDGTYYPTTNGIVWSLTPGTESIAGTDFTRQAVISSVTRDGSGNIGVGVNDPSTKKIDYTVSWTQPYSGSITSSEYLQRYIGNTAWTQTTQAQFNGGTLINTVTTNIAGGEVQLAASSGGDWATPVVSGTYDRSGNTDCNKVFVSGNYAYVGCQNGGGTADFLILDISNPVSLSLTGSLDTNSDINGVVVSGNYAYLATSGNTSELTIINISNKASPSVTSTLDVGGNQDATGISISGNYAYISKLAGSGTARELYAVDISNVSLPTIVGSFEAGVNVNSVAVSGNYAYLATASNSKELLILNISNPASMTEAGSYDATGTVNANDVFVIGTTAYLVSQVNSGTNPEFYIINASNPASPSPIGSYNVGDNVKGVYVSGNFAFLATELATKQFMVLNIQTPSSPTLYGSVNLGANSLGVFISGDYGYVASANDSSEFSVIKGGSGAGYATSGTFESSTFDAGLQVAFNYLTFNITKPAGTNIIYQVAINSDNATWNYFGSYTSPDQIPLANINGRYIRYKATLSGSGSFTPVISDVSVNYSP